GRAHGGRSRSRAVPVRRRPGHLVAADRVHGRHLHPPARHRSRRRGSVLRPLVPATADLRPGRIDRVRVRAVRQRPAGRDPGSRRRPRLAGADRADRQLDHRAHPRRRVHRRPLRRHLDRLHPRALVWLTRAERVRGHHHDHVRSRRPPRHRQDAHAVVPALRDGPDHRRSHHPARARRTRAGRPSRARAARLRELAVLAGGARAVHLLPGHALPRVGAGADVVALQPARRDADLAVLDLRVVPPALGAVHDGGGVDFDLRAARRADRRTAVAVPALHRGAHRRRRQRRLRPGVAGVRDRPCADGAGAPAAVQGDAAAAAPVRRGARPLRRPGGRGARTDGVRRGRRPRPRRRRARCRRPERGDRGRLIASRQAPRL
ncbi:MAG: Inner membrane protein YihY, formerly thought to be RNase BN, partial [uncultured Nocardioidaceae bacterium]